MEYLRDCGYRILVTQPTADSVPIGAIDWTLPTAFILGNEVNGAYLCSAHHLSGWYMHRQITGCWHGGGIASNHAGRGQYLQLSGCGQSSALTRYFVIAFKCKQIRMTMAQDPVRHQKLKVTCSEEECSWALVGLYACFCRLKCWNNRRLLKKRALINTVTAMPAKKDSP